ncbi:hypothetical protein [Streptomyces fructofermentans]|uniref:hypothetical protein n=1 Tax=Streptomyces fructofermentans TaxID=152141 RepID=UPI0037A992F5
MQVQMWASVASLIGVGLGGGLSYLAQLTTQRQVLRSEDRRQAGELAEARRAEQLTLLRTFVETAQRAERTAEDRAATAAWKAVAKDVMDDLWIHERMVHMLFGPRLHERARTYVEALNDVMWQEPVDDTVWDRLRAPKVAFLDAAHSALR